MTPEIRGSVPIHSAGAEFLQAFRQRVARGLLTGKPHPRSNYVVTEANPGRIHIRAADWWTALNVGLNEIDLELAPPGSVSYQVRYWRWASYVLGLCGALGIIGLLLLLTGYAHSYIARSAHLLHGLTVDQYLLALWAMVVFWGFLWPWILILLHKPHLRRLVIRLITEVDGQGGRSPR